MSESAALHFQTSPYAPYANFDCLMRDMSPRVRCWLLSILLGMHPIFCNYKQMFYKPLPTDECHLIQKNMISTLCIFFALFFGDRMQCCC